jgi:hypothetical protein
VRPRFVIAGLLATLALAACDESFTPTDPQGVRFSIYGYLDASADTQWVRVSALRPLLTSGPDLSTARVTLEHTRTGRVIELRDSVFEFPTNPDVTSDSVFLHNFWTAQRLEPGATYRFTATLDDGPAAEAMVTLPPPYSVEVWLGDAQTQPAGDLLRLSGLKHPGLILATTTFGAGPLCPVQRRAFTFDKVDAEVHSIRIDKSLIGSPQCGPALVEKRELLIVGSGAPWPEGRDFATGALGVLEVPSNVSNSLGFLGGVLTRVVPYETCVMERVPGNRDPCRLRYDERTVTLRGRVTEATCRDRPVEGANVELRETDPTPGVGRRVRPMLTRAGAYEIGGLEPERRYTLTIWQFHPVFGYPLFAEYADTLQFVPGENATHHARLIRAEPCGGL